MAKTSFKSVDDYIASQPEAVQAVLQRVRSIIRKAVPGAEEVISYQIPTYKLHGRAVLYFAGWKQHYSLYPATGRVRRGVPGRPCTVRGQQGHHPLPALPARTGEVDRTHREVPRRGSRGAREAEASRAEEAVTPSSDGCPAATAIYCATTCPVDQPVYTKPAARYLEKRALKRHARVLDLWALGVGAVISGDFFGWNFGLVTSGFGGLLAALAVMTLLYIGLCFSIAEMSPALPHAGGAYSFARTAMGPWGGYITGLAENMEYILTPAMIVVGIGGYLGAIFGTPPVVGAALVAGSATPFSSRSTSGGVEMSFRVSVVITICALAVLAVFWIGAMPHFDLHRWALEGGGWLPKGWPGILTALPFALWVYLGIEQLPLAAEESHDPRARHAARHPLRPGDADLCSFLTVILSAGIPPGAAKVGQSQRAAVPGISDASSAKACGRKLLALVRLHGPDRQLPHHHLCLRPADLFAVARRIFSDAGFR